jgi:hypothetical protein
MAVSVVPALLSAVYAQASTALPSALVLYGYGVTDDANPDLLMVGVDDPDSQSSAASSDAGQDMATLSTQRSRDETGTVTCAALSWSGDSDQEATVTAAYTTFEAVATFLRADPTLGIGAPGRVVCEVGDHRLSTLQYDNGCEALVVFTVKFKARI